MQGAPGLHVGPVDSHRARGAELLRDGGDGEPVGQPLGVDAGMAGVEDVAQLVERRSTRS